MQLETEKLKKLWAQQDEQELQNAILDLTESRQGRKFLWWMLTISGIGHQPYAGNALQTAFNCGTLNVGQQLLALITEVSPDGYILMMKENADERRERDEQLGNASDLDRQRDAAGYDDSADE